MKKKPETKISWHCPFKHRSRSWAGEDWVPESHEGEEGAGGDEGQVVLAQVQVHQVQHALEGSERGKPGLKLNPRHISKL